MRKKEIELPKLPRGMGSYSWNDPEHKTIKYRKRVTYKEVTKPLSVYGQTIKEVNDHMKDKEEDFRKHVDGLILEKKTRLLQDDMLNWLELYKSEDVNARSYDRIECTFNTHIKNSALGRMQTQGITADDIQRFMKNLKNSKTKKKLSHSSTKKIFELLCQFFKYYYIKQPYSNPILIATKPKNRNESVQEEELIIWDDNEMTALSKVAAMPYINGESGFLHGLAIIFVMWAFLRIGEARGLQWKDIDLENGIVNVYKQMSRVKNREGEKPKYIEELVIPKYKSIRKYKLNSMALDAIREYKKRKKPKSDEEFIFESRGKVLADTTIKNTYLKMVERAGLDTNKHVTIHGLRHSGISYMLRHKVPVEVVSKMAGHKSIQMTLEVYYSVIEEQKNEAIEVLNKEHAIKFLVCTHNGN